MSKVILAVDPGVKCAGWCCGAPGTEPRSGHTTPPGREPRGWEAIWLEAMVYLSALTYHSPRVVIEAPYQGPNAKSTILVARAVQSWVCAAIQVGDVPIEVTAREWQAAIGDRRRMGETAWQAELLRRAEAIGGTWGEPIVKGRGKGKTEARCQDELSARGIWAWAVAQEKEKP